MKKLISLVVLLSLVAVTGAFAAPANPEEGDSQAYTAIVPSMGAIAEWVAGYFDTYQKEGIYQAVAQVLEEGEGTLNEIAEISLTSKEMEGLNPVHLVAAFFCAGAKPEEIRVTCEQNGLSEMTLVNGFETAKTVCGDEILDTQAYRRLIHFSGIPVDRTTTGGFGSSDGFNELK